MKKKVSIDKSIFLSVFLCFMKVWEIGDYFKMCRESQNTHERRKTPAKCKRLGTLHYVKSIRIGSYSGPHFPAFTLNTERYGVSHRMQSEHGKMRTRITPNTDTFYAVLCMKKLAYLCRLQSHHQLQDALDVDLFKHVSLW